MGLSKGERRMLRRCLTAAIERPCIPAWEFETVIGCSPGDARELLDRVLEDAPLGELALERVVALLSALAGSSQLPLRGRGAVRAADVSALLEKLLAPRAGRAATHPSSVVTRTPLASEAARPRRRRA